jgi:hypothetical protein
MTSSSYLKYFSAIVVLIIIFPLSLQAQLSLTGEYRPRTEIRNGYKIIHTSEDEPAFFTSQRTRLALEYTQDLYTFKISGQDIRTWGEVEQLGDTPNVNIHEAWAKLTLSETWDLQLGRQELVYGDQRLLGSVNWAQQGRSHDVLRLKHQTQSQDFALDVGAAYNQEAQNLLGNDYELANYKVLSYLWMEKQLESFSGSATVVSDGFQLPSGSVNYRYTYGGKLNYSNNGLSLSATAYGQQGDDRNRRNISAYMLAATAKYQWDKLSFVGGFDYLSGGEYSDDNPYRNAFSTLYATNHKFYGHMDYFINIPADTRGGGLQDLHLKAAYNLSQNSTLNVAFHQFWLAQQVLAPSGNNQNLNLGSEIDMALSHSFSDAITAKFGYSIFLEDRTLERLQQRHSDGFQQWGWAMLVLTPQFLN